MGTNNIGFCTEYFLEKKKNLSYSFVFRQPVWPKAHFSHGTAQNTTIKVF